MANPRRGPAFKVGGRIEPPYFVNREEELSALVHDAKTLAQSNVVIAPRRYGKTALLRAAEARLTSQMMIAYVNCLGALRAVDLHDRLVEAVLQALERRRGKGRRLLATWRDVLRKPVVGMREFLEEIGGSLEGIGSIRLKFRAREVDETALLEAALDFPEQLAEEHDEYVLVILDEFQALARFNEGLFALFKERLEAQRRMVYLFSGSSLRLLHEVFGREGKSPLYQMVGRLFLREIPEEDVRRFYRRGLREVHGVEITEAALDRVIERVGGIPYYFQKLGVTLERRLVLQKLGRIAVPEVEEAFQELLEELSADFQERWETRFSEQQRAILQQLARGPQTATEIARHLGVAAPNLSYNLGRLTEAMVLTKEGRSYRITDRVFAVWILDL
jgi:AAA+ ATPase superfamily predicted ATPase